MGATYPVLSLEDFGAQLIRTQDLDPVYVALQKARLERKVLERICLAYWCFYHLGAAAKIAEAETDAEYWRLMTEAALNVSRPDGTKPWPRGAERRHFRGQQAVTAMHELVVKYKNAAQAVAGFVGVQTTPSGYTYNGVAKAAQSHRGFGEWIAFKIADMAERVLGYPVDFGDCALDIYKDPRQGAALYLYQTGKLGGGETPRPWELPITDSQLEDVITELTFKFRKSESPTAEGSLIRKRKVNVQEVETILCKWKSHYKGHYPLLKDSTELHHALTGWGKLADRIKKGAPSGA